MNDSPYRNTADFSSNEPTHCLFCGAERNDRGACVGCGATVRTPSNDEPLASSFRCPRCSEQLQSEPFGRAVVKACTKCHGIFVPALQFSFIVNDYLAGLELPVGKYPPLPPAPSGTANETDARLAQIQCIACDREMDRVNFASRSGATVDVCEAHGIWLDGGELVPILHFVKTRAELGEVPLSEAERQDERALRVELAESLNRERIIDVAADNILRDLFNRPHRRRPY